MPAAAPPVKKKKRHKRDWRVCVRDDEEEGGKEIEVRSLPADNESRIGKRSFSLCPSEIEEKGEINIAEQLPTRYFGKERKESNNHLRLHQRQSPAVVLSERAEDG